MYYSGAECCNNSYEGIVACKVAVLYCNRAIIGNHCCHPSSVIVKYTGVQYDSTNVGIIL